MFSTETYTNRRNRLIEQIGQGIIIIFGNNQVPANYPANQLKFRQDSNFLYFIGIDKPGMVCIIDCSTSDVVLYGNDLTVEEMVWTGTQPMIEELAQQSGILKTKSFNSLSNDIKNYQKNKQKLLYLPPYPADRQLLISELLNINIHEVQVRFSTDLIRAVVNQRSYKSDEEVNEIEKTLNQVTGPMHLHAMHLAVPGNYEYQIAGEMESYALKHGMTMAYESICSVRGEILHNHLKGNKLQKGDLLLIDAGAENSMHYSSDITRTIPVGGEFLPGQRDIYEIVLSAQLESIKMIKPGITYKEVHLNAAKIIFEGLKSVGLVRGNTEEAVESGIHTLFFPHGLGHMMGLDVHDMEDLGENHVGYDDQVKRSELFGTGYLRLGRKLETGFVITVEPGIYFIPALIEKWMAEKKFSDHINYDRLEGYLAFGGVRIEDNILVTEDSHKVLGNPIPKAISDINKIFHS